MSLGSKVNDGIKLAVRLNMGYVHNTVNGQWYKVGSEIKHGLCTQHSELAVV